MLTINGDLVFLIFSVESSSMLADVALHLEFSVAADEVGASDLQSC